MKFIIGFGQKMNEIWDKVKSSPKKIGSAQAKVLKTTAFTAYEIDDTSNSTYTSEPLGLIQTGGSSPVWRILEMRKIKVPALNHYDIYFDVALFIEQAKYMADFEDNFAQQVYFTIYSPTYGQLNINQLRSYFTWRTKVRQGIVLQASSSCAYLYVYELINNIGVTDCLDGFEKLVFIWQEYRKIDVHLDRYLTNWLKDYYICNDFMVSFEELVVKYGLEAFYPDLIAKDKSKKLTFKQLSRISDYKVAHSKFLTDSVMPLYIKCVLCAVLNLQPLFDLYGISLYGVIMGKVPIVSTYQPFGNAIYQARPCKNKHVVVSHLENYTCENGSWSCKKPTGSNSITATLIGYILKYTESLLRIAVGYKYKLSPSPDILIRELQSYTLTQLIGVTQDKGFKQIIDDAVITCFHAFREDPQVAVRSISVPVTQTYVGLVHTMPYSIFYQMRKIEPNDLHEQFYLQAKLMENLTDDFPLPGALDCHLRLYSKMTNDQLRGYFSWRAKIRSAQFPPTNLDNIRLYGSELIHNIGAVDQEDAVNKMVALIHHYGVPKSETLLFIITLIKDYYICQDFTLSFDDFVCKYHLERYYPSVFLSLGKSKNWFVIYNQISNYAFENSRFYTDDLLPVMADCFNLVLKDLEGYFKEKKTSLEEIMVARGLMERHWRPFKNMPYFQAKEITNKKVILAPNESYECKNGFWFASAIPENNPIAPQVAGYIIKRIEARLREAFSFKYKLSPNINKLIASLPSNRSANIGHLVIAALRNPAFDQIIDKTVSAYCQTHRLAKSQMDHKVKAAPVTPVEITINTAILASIRKSAAENQERLLVNAEDETQVMIEIAQEPVVADIADSSGWLGLYGQMTAIDKQVLAIVLSGEDTLAKLRTLSQASGGLMVEVMIERVNELALESIGDNIMASSTEEVTIYDEYLEDIRQMMGRNT